MKCLPMIAAAALLAGSCRPIPLNTLYTRAIEDAMYPDSAKVDTNLFALVRTPADSNWKTINGEDYVLMVTWTSYPYPAPGSPYNNGGYSLWLSAAPQLQRFTNWRRVKNKGLRLQQLLGMPPGTPNTSFVEVWVRPADLFRPCPSPQVGTKSCPLCFSAADSQNTAHVEWITAKRLANYTCQPLYQHYPWTDLGYTYDWNPGNRTHHGVSEYVLKTNSTVYIKRTVPTQAYLTP